MSIGAARWEAKMSEPVFAIHGLGFSYGDLEVLAGLDLEMESGRFYGVLGPNGCGKTTLMDLMIGTRRPNAGNLLFQGRKMSAFSRLSLARELALVPQELGTHFPFTVRETVLMGRHPHIPRFAAPTDADWSAVRKAMAEMEVVHLAAKPVTQISGGEKQRVALARALAQDTPVLLLDEPTSHLDVNHALAVLNCMERRVRRQGRTVVAVMHDLSLAAAFCDHLVLIKKGKTFAAGRCEEVLSGQNLHQVFGVEARVAWDKFANSHIVTFRKPGMAS
jgi:iron complex transport system ATP-binding protein